MSIMGKRVLGVALGLAGGYVAVSAAGVALLSTSAAKRMKEHESLKNMMHSSAIGKKTVVVDPNIEHAYINCVNGSTEVLLKDLPTHYDMYIELSSVCAAYNIKLPGDVRVVVEGTGNKSVIKNSFPETERDDSTPTVHINVERAAYTSVIIDTI